MKYLFFVQIEGRGHLTQALSLAEKLRQAGHEIIAVIVNNNPIRKLPDFFIEEIAAPIYFIKSPYFLINKDGTGIDFSKSVLFNLFRLKEYASSLKSIHKLYKKHQPDVIINFFEPLCGLYNLAYHHNVPCFSIGHQFFAEHPVFNKPSGHFKDYQYFQFFNHLTSYGSQALIALSFTKEVDVLEKSLFVCPPLLRDCVRTLKPKNENIILSYILNSGYCEEIKSWANSHPEQRIEAFWDKKGAKEETNFKNLTFHLISGAKFTSFLQDCSIYVSTAGFESIAEAAYLQKDILMVPTKNHYEQLCNALDAKRAGLAISDTFFNIDLVLKEKRHSLEAKRLFKTWVDSQSNKIIELVTLKRIN